MTAMRLKRYPSPSGGFALGKMGVGATLLKQGKTARDYVQSGLVAMWDGIENAGWGIHDPNATTWKDLIGQYDGAVNLSGLSWGEDHLHFTSGYNMNFGAVPIGSGALWIEVCLDATSVTKMTCYVSQGSARYIAAPSGDPRAVAFRSGQSGYVGYTGAIPPGTISAGYTSDALTHYLFTDAVLRRQTAYTSAYRFNSTGLLMNREYKTTYGSGVFDAYCVRVYSRALTAAEIAANSAIDKERFNLP